MVFELVLFIKFLKYLANVNGESDKRAGEK